MSQENFINCLKARQKTIRESLEKRRDNIQDHSDWRFFSKQELEGRKAELDNTLDMITRLK